MAESIKLSSRPSLGNEGVSRRDFGTRALLGSASVPLIGPRALHAAAPFSHIAEVTTRAHPIISQEAIEVLYQLISSRVHYWKNYKEQYLHGIPRRVLTGAEVTAQYDYFTLRFQDLKISCSLSEKAFDSHGQEPLFTGLIRDYENHVREHFIEVESDTRKLVDKYIIDPSVRFAIFSELSRLRRDIFQEPELERTIDNFQKRSADIRYKIESYIGKDWTFPLQHIISEIRSGYSSELVIETLIKLRGPDRCDTAIVKEQIQYYEPIARAISQYKLFRPLKTYLDEGRGKELFESLKGLPSAAGENSEEPQTIGASYYLKLFHLSHNDCLSEQLFPRKGKDSAVKYVSELFSHFSTPTYQMELDQDSPLEGRLRPNQNPIEKRKDLEQLAYPVNFYLEDIKLKSQLFQTMKAALKSAWPEMAHHLARINAFKAINDSFHNCEQQLINLYDQITQGKTNLNDVNENKQFTEPFELTRAYLGSDFRSYIEAVQNNEAELIREVNSIPRNYFRNLTE